MSLKSRRECLEFIINAIENNNEYDLGTFIDLTRK